MHRIFTRFSSLGNCFTLLYTAQRQNKHSKLDFLRHWWRPWLNKRSLGQWLLSTWLFMLSCVIKSLSMVDPSINSRIQQITIIMQQLEVLNSGYFILFKHTLSFLIVIFAVEEVFNFITNCTVRDWSGSCLLWQWVLPGLLFAYILTIYR